jgi:hypothetical protein
MTTTVINLKGRKPQTIKDGEVYIGRACFMGGWALPASKWANPYTLKMGSRDDILEKYEDYILKSPLLKEIEELRGKTLCCWCAPQPCHGNVLIKLLDQ